MTDSQLPTALAAIRAALRDDEQLFSDRDRANAGLATREDEVHKEAANRRCANGGSDTDEGRAVTIQQFEALTAERHELNTTCGQSIRKLWDLTSAAMEVAGSHATAILQFEGRRLDELVLPALRPHLLQSAEPTVARYASSTPKGHRAQTLRDALAELTGEEYRECNVLTRLALLTASNFKEWWIQDMRRQTTKRSQAVLLAIETFEKLS